MTQEAGLPFSSQMFGTLVNLGVGRSWISNSIVMMIGSLDELNAMSQEDALSYLSADYISFCESSESWLCICFPTGEFFFNCSNMRSSYVVFVQIVFLFRRLIVPKEKFDI